jgi:hypothetical protein
MMATAVGHQAQATTTTTEALPPIRVHAQPAGCYDCLENMLAFSDEGRRGQIVKDADAVQISSIPRMKKCFGWLQMGGRQLCSLPSALHPRCHKQHGWEDRQLFSTNQYHGIVYEYIPEGDNDRGDIQSVLDFLWLASFE